MKAKEIIELLEEYVGMAKNGNNTVVVYKNPSQADYKEMAKVAIDSKRKFEAVRYIADSKTKIVWVADAWVADHLIMHEIAKLDSKYGWSLTSHQVEGMANVIDNKFAVANDYWDDYKQYAKQNGTASGPLPEIFFPIFHTDWSFTNRYVQGVQSIVDSYKKKYIKLLNKNQLLSFNDF